MKKISAKHILVDQEFEANDIVSKLDAGKGFEELAMAYSNCPSGKTGGFLGEFGRGKMVREFDKKAFALKPGETSGPVRTRFGYHIIKRVD